MSYSKHAPFRDIVALEKRKMHEYCMVKKYLRGSDGSLLEFADLYYREVGK